MELEDKDLKKESRGNYTTKGMTLVGLQTGALMRIADATEAMAKNYIQLQNERDRYERMYKSERAGREAAERSNRGLKAAITRMKNKRKD